MHAYYCNSKSERVELMVVLFIVFQFEIHLFCTIRYSQHKGHYEFRIHKLSTTGRLKNQNQSKNKQKTQKNTQTYNQEYTIYIPKNLHSGYVVNIYNTDFQFQSVFFQIYRLYNYLINTQR